MWCLYVISFLYVRNKCQRWEKSGKKCPGSEMSGWEMSDYRKSCAFHETNLIEQSCAIVRNLMRNNHYSDCAIISDYNQTCTCFVLHTEKSFRNLIESNRNRKIVNTI